MCHKLLPALTLILLASLLLGGCQSVEAPTAPTEAAVAPTMASTAVEEPTGIAEPSGTFVVAQGPDPRTLDPHMSTYTFDENVYGQISEKLVVFSPDMKEIIPHLATSLEQIEPNTWEIKIRQGVKFHNGEVMTAEDVAFSLEHLRDSAAFAVYSSGILPGSTAKVVDAETVHFTTASPTALIPAMLARGGFVYPREYTLQVGEEFATKPIGTGAHRFVEWLKDDHITLEAFTDYWGGVPSIKEVIFRPIPDGTARVAALVAGDVDLIYGLPLDALPTVEGSEDLEVVTCPGMRIYALGTDWRTGDTQFELEYDPEETPFQDIRVRQAMNYAIDKESILKNLFYGEGVLLTGQMLNEAYFGYNPDLEPYPYDPEKARALLAEAGYSDLTFPLKCPSGRFTLDKEVCEALVGQLAEVGITAELQLFEPGDFAATASKSQMGPVYYGGLLSPSDAYFMYAVLAVTSAYRYFPPIEEYDRLIAEAAVETEPAKRLDLYNQAAAIFREQAGNVTLWSINEMYGVNKRVKGWVPNWDEHFTMTGVTLEE